MRKPNGYTLMEVVFSVLVLSIITATILPAFIKIYQERLTIREQHQAQTYLANIIQEWLFDQKSPEPNDYITINGTAYRQNIHLSHNALKVCLNWNGQNERTYTICDYGKKFVQ